jgi:hypothetical protein
MYSPKSSGVHVVAGTNIDNRLALEILKTEFNLAISRNLKAGSL